MSACEIVVSNIVHTRHSGSHHAASHILKRAGLSIWIDLDRMEQAAEQSFLFSIDKFNLISFHQRDHGPNFRSEAPVVPLGHYVRQIAAELLPNQTLGSVHLLTFPRVLGAGFNPLSVYVARNFAGVDVLYIYEVRNTFGDMHAYVGTPSGKSVTMIADKILHVSPFFPLDGFYRLRLRVDNRFIKLAMRYFIAGRPALTATLRGTCERLTDWAIVASLVKTCQYPFRPIISIHIEALKLWLKKVPFYKRPEPPALWSRAKDFDGAE